MAEKVRRPRDEFQPFVDHITQHLEAQGAEHYFGGSWRRQRPLIADLDVVVIAPHDDEAPSVLDMPGFEAERAGQDIIQGRLFRTGPKGGISLEQGTPLEIDNGVHVDFWFIKREALGPFMWFITGPKELNIAMRASAKAKGWELSQYHLKDENGKRVDLQYPYDKVQSKNDISHWVLEQHVSFTLGWPWIPPSHRDEWEEIVQESQHAVETYKVMSSLGDHEYTVSKTPAGTYTCTCKGFFYRGKCRHIEEVRG